MLLYFKNWDETVGEKEVWINAEYSSWLLFIIQLNLVALGREFGKIYVYIHMYIYI